eukprot:5790323-Ditylum_brightwellii.AAC.1
MANTALRWGLFSILGVGLLIHIFFFISIIKHRNNESVRIAQPIGQALLAAAGVTSLVGGCLFTAPPSNATCALIEPVIFVSINLIGASLAGMVWRVQNLLAPLMNVGSNLSTAHGIENIFTFLQQRSKKNLMAVFTDLGESSCRRNYAAANAGRRRPSIRRKVTALAMIRVVVFLMLPQIALQALILGLPSLRQSSAPVPADQCLRPPGTEWSLWLGAFFVVFSFASAILLASSPDSRSASFPSVLDEEESLRKAFCTFMIVVVTAGPILALTSESSSPNAKLYARFSLLIGVVVPHIHYVLWKRLRPIWYEKDFSVRKKIRNESNASVSKTSSMIMHPRRDSLPGKRTSLSNTKLAEERLNATKAALEEGHIFEEMGMIGKCIEVYNKALSEWRFDRSNGGGERIGSFTLVEVNSFSQEDVNNITKLLIAKGRCLEEIKPTKAAESFIRTLDIFEFAPATEHLKNRSATFPCFHTLFRLLREGRIERNISFEKDLALRFVRESKEHPDHSHYACALAINAEMKARSGSIASALEEFELMKEKYDLGKHACAIRKNDGIDLCALAYSRSALWHLQNGDEIKSISICDQVIEMLPNLQYSLENEDAETVHAIFIPIVRILKWKGQVTRMNELYKNKIYKNTAKQ